MLAVALDHVRPPLPVGLPGAVRVIVESCWHKEATQRPVAQVVREAIDAVEVGLSTEQSMWLDEPRGHPVYFEQVGIIRKQVADPGNSDQENSDGNSADDGGASAMSAANTGAELVAQPVRKPKGLFGWPWSMRRR